MPNTDGDTTPLADYRDLDADNDGIQDAIEGAGGAAGDPDNDGRVGAGAVVDTDGDGWSNVVDSSNGGTAFTVPNSDGDSPALADYRDLDADNDGIPDSREGNSTGSPNIDANNDGVIDVCADVDGDGLCDSVDPNQGGTPPTIPNTDGTGPPDYRDVDSDGDGITDATEATPPGANPDINGDGRLDGCVDVDGDGLCDSVDPNQGGIPLPLPNTDGDGQPDFRDTDSDGDLVDDLTESNDGNHDGRPDRIPGGSDNDGDGLDDVFLGPPVFPDTDEDGKQDWRDVDDDADGIPTAGEDRNDNGDPTDDDTDGDGTPDYLDPFDDVKKLLVTVTDPLACTGPGNAVTVTAKSTNSSLIAVAANFSATLPAGLIGVPGSCVSTVGSCTVNATSASWSGTLQSGQTVTITYKAQVGDVPVNTLLCVNSQLDWNGGIPLVVQACEKVDCPPVGPGDPLPSSSEMSDQKAGSVLIYNIYTSSTDPTRQNTRINVTNVHPVLAANVHLFFVAEGCSVADSYICLTGNQTASFLASDLDPGTTGYLVAVAVDATGCPISFNYLVGDEYVKFASGHAANLNAQAIAGLPAGLPACDSNSGTATLAFDGVSYNRVPRTLAASNIGSRADSNDTLLILNRIGGNLGTGAAALGSIFGIFYDDAEVGLSFSLNANCQFRNSISNSFPRITPRFETFVPAGRTGWFKLFSQSDVGMTGAIINFNPNAAASAGAFNQGHNLHVLTLSAGQSYVIPVFPPSC